MLIGTEGASRVDSVEAKFFDPRPNRIHVKLVDQMTRASWSTDGSQRRW